MLTNADKRASEDIVLSAGFYSGLFEMHFGLFNPLLPV